MRSYGSATQRTSECVSGHLMKTKANRSHWCFVNKDTEARCTVQIKQHIALYLTWTEMSQWCILVKITNQWVLFVCIMGKFNRIKFDFFCFSCCIISLSLSYFPRRPTHPLTTSARCRKGKSIISLSFRWCSCFSCVRLGCTLYRTWRWSFLCWCLSSYPSGETWNTFKTTWTCSTVWR